jgi:hypothetical protein
MPVRQQISKTFEEVIPSYSIKSTYPTTSSSSVNMNSLALVSRGNVGTTAHAVFTHLHSSIRSKRRISIQWMYGYS